MSTILISNGHPYGVMTNQVIGRLRALNAQLPRLSEAIATASSAYDGIPGTQFEIGRGMQGMPSAPPMPAPMPRNAQAGPNLFGVTADPDQPGKQGQAYSYACGQLQTAWNDFWQTARGYIEALDNGTAG